MIERVTLEFYKPYLKSYSIVRKEVDKTKLNYEINKLQRKGYEVHVHNH